MLGVAGPVIENYSRTTNLPWTIDGRAIAKQFNIPRVQLLNDLEATAYGLLWLRPDELEVLNAGNPPKNGRPGSHCAGTGLGEGIIIWDGKHTVPCRPREVIRILHPTMIKKLNCSDISGLSISM